MGYSPRLAVDSPPAGSCKPVGCQLRARQILFARRYGFTVWTVLSKCFFFSFCFVVAGMILKEGLFLLDNKVKIGLF